METIFANTTVNVPAGGFYNIILTRSEEQQPEDLQMTMM